MASAETEKDGRRGAGLTLTTAAFIFLVLRLLAVSGYDWHTAFAVLHTINLDDTLGLVVGTVMADSIVSGLLLTFFVPAAVFRLVADLREARESKNRELAEGQRPERPDLEGVMLLLVALATVVAYVGSFHLWWLPLLMVAVGGLMFGLGYGMRAGGRLQRVALGASRNLGLLIGAAMLTGAATVSTPWVPLERIELRSGVELRGFVMEAEPGFLKLLTEHGRDFLILTDEEVGSRQKIMEH